VKDVKEERENTDFNQVFAFSKVNRPCLDGCIGFNPVVDTVPVVGEGGREGGRGGGAGRIISQ
jgi:hypothetical protein